MRPSIALAALLVATLAPAARPLDLVQAWQAAASGDAEYGAAQAAGEAGRTRRAQADALWRPTLGVSATAGLGMSETGTTGARFSAPGFGQSTGVAFDTSVNHGATGRVAITARQPLVNGERQVQRRQLELGADAAALDLAAAGQALALRVAQAYFDLVLAGQSAQVLRRQEVALERARAQVRERFELGEVPITDSHEASARAQGVKAQVLAAGTEIDLKRAMLADITGLPIERLVPLIPAGAVRFDGLPAMEQAIAMATENNPQLRARAAALDSARHEVEKLSAGAAVSVDLVAQYGRERLAGSGDYGSASGSAANGLIGVQISVPLLTGGYRSARREEAAHLADKAAAELRDRKSVV